MTTKLTMRDALPILRQALGCKEIKFIAAHEVVGNDLANFFEMTTDDDPVVDEFTNERQSDWDKYKPTVKGYASSSNC